MATTVISGKITDSAGTGLSGVTVTAVLRPRPAFATATGTELSSAQATRTATDGTYSFTLTRTADITPTDSYYEIVERIPDNHGGYVQHIIQVGAVAQSVYASRVQSGAPAPSVATYLTQEAGDARYVQAPGSFGAAILAPHATGDGGVAATYARSDHRHAPGSYGSAAVRGALTGSDLWDGKQFRETDTGKLFVYHAGAVAWRQQMETVLCTAATRPTSLLYEGLRIHETDTDLRYFYDGADWYLEGEQALITVDLGGANATIDSGTLSVVQNAGQLRVVFEGLMTATGGTILLRFNGDSGANYSRNLIGFINSAVVTTAVTVGASEFAGTTIHTTANNRTTIEIRVPRYRSANHKLIISDAVDIDANSAATLAIWRGGGKWGSTAAITSVQATASTSTFIAGSSLTVYARSTKG